MRHRDGKRYVRHGRIEGLDELLKQIAGWPEVKKVISGQIRNTGGSGGGHGLVIRVQREEQGRLKCVASHNSQHQDLTIITGCPGRIAERIRAQAWGK
ncbi:MAG: DUF2103 domain-containing protein [Patescibacteria group bacterium]|jgi:hypothetical protein